MYAGRGDTVPLPTTGHLHIQRTGKGYVYWENDERWDKEKKCSVDSRRIIGKLDPEDPSRMFPNKTYQEIFGAKVEYDSCDSRLSFGSYAVLKAAAEKIGCLGVLQAVFPWEWDRILALAVHSICAQTATAQDFPYWAFDHYCGLAKPISSEEITNIYNQIASDSKKIDEFMKSFWKAYTAAVGEDKERVLGFDSTNQSVSSASNMLAEWGHAKRNDNYPQINTALFADEKTGIPVYYEHFIGSILDKSETPYTVEKAESLGFQKIFLMMDRGYFSAKVATAIDKMNLEFAVMTPSDIKAAKELIDENGKTIQRVQKYYIPEENVYGIAVPDTKILGGKYTAYVYFDPDRAHREHNYIHQKIAELKQLAEKRVRFTENLAKKCRPWLIIEKNESTEKSVSTTGKNFTVQENAPAIQEELDGAGFFVIVSNTTLDAGKIIQIARMRDTDEKSFRRMKWHFGLTSSYTHNLETYEGKMFMAFVATIIIESYRWFLRTELKSHSSETVRVTLNELAKYKIQEMPNHTWLPIYAVTRKQKDILSCFGLDEVKLEAYARQVHMKSD